MPHLTYFTQSFILSGEFLPSCLLSRSKYAPKYLACLGDTGQALPISFTVRTGYLIQVEWFNWIC
jgi:hypothetical protein